MMPLSLTIRDLSNHMNSFSDFFKTYCGVAVLCFALAAPSVSRAAGQWEFLQVTCSKELDQFSLRTMHVERNIGDIDGFKEGDDPLKSQESAFKRLETENNIYRPESLLSKKPYICELPHGTVSMEFESYRVSHRPLSSFGLLIKFNGVTVHQLSSYDGSFAHTSLMDLYSGDGALEDCTFPDEGEDRTPSCKGVKFPAAALSKNQK
ncbi:hypothetical protein [Bradyrhizobium sp. LA7.1]|uniref:hypothetical protein n=1 Tax=Bradyrhizobium sp. LA7.1 TaxID=3156324 RepID=UPI003398E578